MADCTGTLIVSLNHCAVTSDSKTDGTSRLHSLEYICTQLWLSVGSYLIMCNAKSTVALRDQKVDSLETCYRQIESVESRTLKLCLNMCLSDGGRFRAIGTVCGSTSLHLSSCSLILEIVDNQGFFTNCCRQLPKTCVVCC